MRINIGFAIGVCWTRELQEMFRTALACEIELAYCQKYIMFVWYPCFELNEKSVALGKHCRLGIKANRQCSFKQTVFVMIPDASDFEMIIAA